MSKQKKKFVSKIIKSSKSEKTNSILGNIITIRNRLEGGCTVSINGHILPFVTDISYKKISADEMPRVTITFDAFAICDIPVSVVNICAAKLGRASAYKDKSKTKKD